MRLWIYYERFFVLFRRYYSWTKKATIGKGSSRVVGDAVPVLANKSGARTLSVVASYPGHASSWAEREYVALHTEIY